LHPNSIFGFFEVDDQLAHYELHGIFVMLLISLNSIQNPQNLIEVILLVLVLLFVQIPHPNQHIMQLNNIDSRTFTLRQTHLTEALNEDLPHEPQL